MTTTEIEQALDDLTGITFTYKRRKQTITRYEISEEREVVNIYTSGRDIKRCSYEDIHLFLNRIYQEIEQAGATHHTPPQLPTANTHPMIPNISTIMDESPLSKCINALMEELENGTPDPTRTKHKIDITNAIVKAEVAKTNRINLYQRAVDNTKFN